MKENLSFLILVLFGIAVIFIGGYLVYKNRQLVGGEIFKNIDGINKNIDGSLENEMAKKDTPEIFSPLDRSSERITKKKFGDYITWQNSPVQPERFSGFHTGVDFEVFANELNSEVKVKAICGGNILLKEYIAGYGGVVVESCVLDNEPVTVLYGHLRLDSINKNIGEDMMPGEILGSLGAAYSQETDGERKHLHLGIHRGSQISVLGYVQSQAELVDWFDPCDYICNQ